MTVPIGWPSNFFTELVNCGVMSLADAVMARKPQEEAADMNAPDSSVRASISFPRELYQTLEVIARQKKVSLAWVVRDAAEHYVSDKWPLFKGQA